MMIRLRQYDEFMVDSCLDQAVGHFQGMTIRIFVAATDNEHQTARNSVDVLIVAGVVVCCLRASRQIKIGFMQKGIREITDRCGGHANVESRGRLSQSADGEITSPRIPPHADTIDIYERMAW